MISSAVLLFSLILPPVVSAGQCGWWTDLCENNWNPPLPFGSDEDICGLSQVTNWPLNTEKEATCTFTGITGNTYMLYISIDNDVLWCELNGIGVQGYYEHENCAPSDPASGLSVQLSQDIVSGPNTIICQVRDRGGESYFDACVVSSSQGTEEVCDGIDNDNDGTNNEGFPTGCCDNNGPTGSACCTSTGELISPKPNCCDINGNPVNSLCADSFACTTPEICDPTDPAADADGCIRTLDDTVCDDGFACTINEKCDPTNGDADAEGCVRDKDDTKCTKTYECQVRKCDPPGDPSDGCVFDQMAGDLFCTTMHGTGDPCKDDSTCVNSFAPLPPGDKYYLDGCLKNKYKCDINTYPERCCGLSSDDLGCQQYCEGSGGRTDLWGLGTFGCGFDPKGGGSLYEWFACSGQGLMASPPTRNDIVWGGASATATWGHGAGCQCSINNNANPKTCSDWLGTYNANFSWFCDGTGLLYSDPTGFGWVDECGEYYDGGSIYECNHRWCMVSYRPGAYCSANQCSTPIWMWTNGGYSDCPTGQEYCCWGSGGTTSIPTTSIITIATSTTITTTTSTTSTSTSSTSTTSTSTTITTTTVTITTSTVCPDEPPPDEPPSDPPPITPPPPPPGG